MSNFNKDELSQIALSLKVFSIDMVQEAHSGHPGMPMGMADITAVLVANYLNFTPQNPKWLNRDRFILSNGHGSALQYAMLHFLGYKDFNFEQIKNFRQLHSNTHGHPEFNNYNGVETTTGPLGQGISNAVGMAIAAHKLQALYPNIQLNYNIYCYAGDGCMMEGITQESISLAGHLRLRNLILIYDNNQISIDGSTNLAFSEDIEGRFKAANWDVISINGHDYQQIDNAFQSALSRNSDKPILINAHTCIAHNAPTKEGMASTHGAPLGEDEIKSFKEIYGLQDKSFAINKETLKLWEKITKNGHNKYNKWVENNQINFDKIQQDTLQKFILEAAQDLENEAYKLININNNKDAEPSRVSSKRAVDIISRNSCVIFGSADLTDSNCIRVENYKPFNDKNRNGNFIHYGVREHAMAGIMNGIALSGLLLPLGATFLTFTDYMRPAIRLSCMMKLKILYIMTHDSIGLGEDGPTHQPIEHLPSLRMIPNLCVLRPADATETLIAYKIALQHEGPSLIALSRQSLPNISKSKDFKDYHEFGAKMILYNADASYKVVIYATGSEVKIAIDVCKSLMLQGIKAAVVSVLDYNKFIHKRFQFEGKYIKKSLQLKVAIEAASEGLWNKIIGSDGIFFGMNQFGASGKCNDLYEHFDLTENKITDSILERLYV